MRPGPRQPGPDPTDGEFGTGPGGPSEEHKRALSIADTRAAWHVHACLVCGRLGEPGPGCINCRRTGYDQTPCLVCSAQNDGVGEAT